MGRLRWPIYAYHYEILLQQLILAEPGDHRGARGDVQLGEDPAQVCGDGPGADLKNRADRLVRQALGNQAGNRQLARGEYEDEYEGEYENMAAPANQQEALAEYMAAVASRAQTEAEAEAMIGAAVVTTLSNADRARIYSVLANLNRGAAALTRILRRRRATRPFVRTVPTIVRSTARTLARRAASGRPVTPRVAGRVMASSTRRVLGSPRYTAAAIRRNLRGARIATRARQQTVRRGARQGSRQRAIRG